MIDPSTGLELHASWKPMDTLPPLPTGQDAYLNVLVLLEPKEHLRHRVAVASLRERFKLVNNQFDFDMPPMVAWQELLPINQEPPWIKGDGFNG